MVTITDNSGGVNGSKQSVSLTGTGVYLRASLAPTLLFFGNQVVGATSAPMKVVLTSIGTTDLGLSGITLTAANAGDFAQTNNCPPTMPPGAKCTINITFTPSIMGVETGTLTVNDDAPDSPQTAALVGNSGGPLTCDATSLVISRVIGRGARCSNIEVPSGPKPRTASALGMASYAEAMMEQARRMGELSKGPK